MDASKQPAAQCTYCKNKGYAKGLDDYGHIHCRMCRYNVNGWARDRPDPATGEVWSVYCDSAQNGVNVRQVPIINRDHPGVFGIPGYIFRTPCRMIQVTLGKQPATKMFIIHEPLLTTSSAYFQGALQTTFAEGQNCHVDLCEEDPLVFGLLNEYLYKADIKPSFETLDFKSPLVCFGELWLLSHYLQMLKLVNYSMWRILLWMDETHEATIASSTSTPPSLNIGDIYDLYVKAPMDSRLRKFLVDLLVWSGWNLKLGDEAPHLMVREMVDELRKRCDIGKAGSPLLDVRNYYVGEEELVPVIGKKVDNA